MVASRNKDTQASPQQKADAGKSGQWLYLRGAGGEGGGGGGSPNKHQIWPY